LLGSRRLGFGAGGRGGGGLRCSGVVVVEALFLLSF
jgi:hypothetical protein